MQMNEEEDVTIGFPRRLNQNEALELTAKDVDGILDEIQDLNIRMGRLLEKVHTIIRKNTVKKEALNDECTDDPSRI